MFCQRPAIWPVACFHVSGMGDSIVADLSPAGFPHRNMFLQPACTAALTGGLSLVWLPGWRVTAAIGVGSAATVCTAL
jgi:hypothetical protein